MQILERNPSNYSVPYNFENNGYIVYALQFIPIDIELVKALRAFVIELIKKYEVPPVSSGSPVITTGGGTTTGGTGTTTTGGNKQQDDQKKLEESGKVTPVPTKSSFSGIMPLLFVGIGAYFLFGKSSKNKN